jgi:hypothetical protein
LPDHVAEASSLGELALVLQPQRNAAMWLRKLPPALSTEHAAPFDAFPRFNGLTTRDADDALQQKFHDAARAAGCPPLAATCADAQLLARAFAEIQGSNAVTLRCERINELRHRTLHCDGVPLRLLTTYRGIGTRWLSNQDADHGAIGQGDDLICKGRPGNVRYMQAGQVVLFRGISTFFLRDGTVIEETSDTRPFMHGEPKVHGPEHWRWVFVVNEIRPTY